MYALCVHSLTRNHFLNGIMLLVDHRRIPNSLVFTLFQYKLNLFCHRNYFTVHTLNNGVVCSCYKIYIIHYWTGWDRQTTTTFAKIGQRVKINNYVVKF